MNAAKMAAHRRTAFEKKQNYISPEHRIQEKLWEKQVHLDYIAAYHIEQSDKIENQNL
jgi:hypothetical protein